MNYLCQICNRECEEQDRHACMETLRLNLGCGCMIKPECINFDFTQKNIDGIPTDIVGRIEEISDIFLPCTFKSIVCLHVIEHLPYKEGLKMLKNCYAILRNKGTLLIEAPDMEKLIGMYGKIPFRELMQEFYNDKKDGELWVHQWGWTGKELAKEMKSCGFEIVEISDGITHHKAWRDFRVVGVKNEH